ncbi:MAG: CvpA family protein [Spirochaetes bacterium]|nr:CvpA family protein [Spirochaetota bacterium]
MNTLDWILVAIAGAFAARCLFRGFIKETLSAAALLAGGLAGIVFYRQAGELIGRISGLTDFLEIAGFAAAFVIAFVVVKLIETAMRASVEALRLGWADRLLGLVLGTVEGLIIVCLVLILLARQPVFHLEPLLEGSAIARFLLPILVENGALPG